MKTLNLFLFIFAGLFLNRHQTLQDTNPSLSKIDTHLENLLADPEIQALSAGVLYNGHSFIFHKGTLLNGNSPTDETLYEIASLTKTFTGTLLAHAIVDGKASIDDDIRNYLPYRLPNLEYDNQPITFRHLVTHQSGLPHMFPNREGFFEDPNWNELPFKINKLQDGYSEEEFFTELSQIQLDATPGTNFQYSNVGANLVGYILEEIYNQPFEDLLKEKVLAPLNMSDTKISLSETNLEFLAEGQNIKQIKMPFRVNKEMNAEGGIISNTENMIRYINYHLKTDDKVVCTSHQYLWDGKYGDFEAGLFWQVNKNGDNPDKIFQNGGSFGTSSWITLIPEKSIGVFIVTNIAGPEIHQKLSETTEKIIKELN